MILPTGWHWQSGEIHTRPPERVLYLIDPQDRKRATIYPNGVWFVWDRNGVGGENDKVEEPRSAGLRMLAAKEQVICAMLRAGWWTLVDPHA